MPEEIIKMTKDKDELKEIRLPEELSYVGRILIGEYQLQAWMDWFIQHTDRRITKEQILKAVEGYSLNYSW